MKTGKFARGWQLTKSSWQVLRLDKELAIIPIISLAVELITLVGLVAVDVTLPPVVAM